MTRDSAKRKLPLTVKAGPFAATEGERKLVTVLFADVAQSARFVAGCDPEDADRQLFSLLQIMIEGVHRYGGTVNQVMGDGIMALFGAPRAQEDHGLRACLAAEAILARFSLLQQDTDGLADARVRLGLSTGEVVVRAAHDDFGLKYRIVGEAVYLAQRLETAAQSGSALMDGATLRLVSDLVSFRPAGSVRLKLDADPVLAFAMCGLRNDYSGRLRRAREPVCAFIGRSRDLDRLKSFWCDAEAGQGRVSVVTGEAGIGKSRLLQEFVATLPASAHSLVMCECLPTGAARVLSPIARILRALIRKGEAADGVIDPLSIERLLRDAAIEGNLARAAVADSLGFSSDDPGWAGLDPPERLQIAVETVGQLLVTAGRQNPQIILLEDFHWADSETRALAGELAQRAMSARLLLIVTSRSHHEKPWRAWPAVRQMELRALSPEQTTAMLEDLLGSGHDLEELRHLLAVKTQGNPFFLEECVRSLEDSGSLERHSNGRQLVVPVAALEIPSTVQGVLAARIDSLPEDERSILVCGSVIGSRLDVGLLRNICPFAREQQLRCLSRLQQAGFLERTRIVPNLEYSFRHALIHDVAYGTILKSKRLLLHAKVLNAIERRSSRKLSGRIELLAHHASEAQHWPKAFAYNRRAARRAQTRSANREAGAFFKAALQALERCPRSPQYVAREIDTRLELFQVLSTLGRHEHTNRELLTCQALARQLNDERRLAKVASATAMDYWVKGDFNEALRIGRDALSKAVDMKDLDSEIEFTVRFGALCIDRGAFDEACGWLQAAIGKIPGEALFKRFGLLVIASVGARTSLARALGEMGRFSDAVRVGDEGIRIADEAGHAFSQVYAQTFVGNALLRKGDFARSLAPLQRSFELCVATRAKMLYPLCAATLGYALVRLGQISEGVNLLEQAASAAKQRDIKFQLSQELGWLGEAYLIAGDTEKAWTLANTALGYARKHGERGDEAWAHWLLGEICVRSDSAAAEASFRSAERLASACGMRPLMAHVSFGLGRLSWQRKDFDSAKAHFDLAVDSYRALQMDYWLDQATKRVALLEKLPGQSPAPLHDKAVVLADKR